MYILSDGSRNNLLNCFVTSTHPIKHTEDIAYTVYWWPNVTENGIVMGNTFPNM